MKDSKNNNYKRNTEGFVAFKQAEKLKNIEKIEKAILKLKKWVQSGKIQKVTVAGVAREAKVAPATIYNNPGLVEKIKQASTLRLVCSKEDKPRVEAKEEYLGERIRKLTNEIQELKRRNELLLGNLERKTTEVIELKARLALFDGSGVLQIGSGKEIT
ncbi:conserved hypothetical protein [uncultured Sporomusa sp.]|uniref:Uncharacterized protein n=1 Tax=uncultured Sporomusa sp. TaxID=307249 RepID=A0A212LXW1_9FIRM|nr:hypothetical protein [uncultured Sporomusa sp.]SCM82307.1 conserved hypothetical protein [uncultured Sporomusa sp.]